MYRSEVMYDAWGWTGTDWVRGFEIGLDAKTQLYVFFVNDNVRQRYYLKESELNYSKEKPE
jgi:hypothetical protein